ncbi:MAG: hypothetical protein RLY40_1244, partial [Pseudomonadota bacterium]
MTHPKFSVEKQVLLEALTNIGVIKWG